jgi:Fe2+ transport system protein B
MSLTALLRSKNKYLSKFLKMSEEFLANANEGNLDELDKLQENREEILKNITRFDRKIEEIAAKLNEAERTETLINTVKLSMLERESLVHKILETDLKLMEHIEAKKNKLIQDLHQNKKSREIVGKFKSSWIAESGEELDTCL